ncbi:MAG: methyltransferase domain-containing protein [Alphaproteobacteria bacterium]|nr:methyltransferase domain-containing protein [Alphaproteobacteria bacterium]
MAVEAAMPGAGAGWRDWPLRLRDRLLGDPQFRRLAAKFPLTRPIARRRTRALFDLCAGFVYSQVLLACVRSRLFDALRDGPQTLEALSRHCALPGEGMLRLLRAAIALKLVARRRGERFGLGSLGAAMVRNPGVAAMVEHHALLYADLQDPLALLRGETAQASALSRFWGYSRAADPGDLSSERVAAYSALMGESQALVAAEVLDAYPLTRHRHLLDIGGGDGSFIVAAAARATGLHFTLFDLPAVAEQAGKRFAAVGIADRTITVGGDFHRDPLPTGADLITLVRVVHDHDDPAALSLLRAVHDALPSGGQLLLAEPMADTPGATAMGDAYFGFYLLALGQGRPRSRAELSEMLRQAGFTAIRHVASATPLLVGLLIAERERC